MGVHSVYGKLN